MQALYTEKEAFAQTSLAAQEAALNKRLNAAASGLEEVSWAKKSYQRLLIRLKQDVITLEKRKNQVEKEIKFDKLSVAETQRQLLINREMAVKACQLKQELKEEVSRKEWDWERQVELKREEANKNSETKARAMKREEEVRDIAQQTQLEKDYSQKAWRKFLLANLVLKKMLKQKIQQGQHRFGHIERAFQQIKTATGVTDSGDLVQRFLNKETNYGTLLASISKSEEELTTKKKQNEQLKDRLRKLKEQTSSLNQIFKGQQSADKLNEAVKTLAQIDQRQAKSKLRLKLIDQLAHRLQMKIRRIEKRPTAEEHGFKGLISVSQKALLFLKEMEPAEYRKFWLQSGREEQVVALGNVRLSQDRNTLQTQTSNQKSSRRRKANKL